jgi:hypothetical protein
MLAQALDSKPITNLLRNIDDENIRALMDYFHLEDYDAFVRYAVSIGLKMLPKHDNHEH